MSNDNYGFSGGEWAVTAPEGDDGYHEVSIGDSDEWSDVTFYGVKARENAHLFKTAPKMYRFLDDLVDGCLDEGHNNELISLLAEARGEK